MDTSTCASSVDRSFGPWAGEGCRGGFDFTLRFEESILCLPILSIFMVVLPLRLRQLARSTQKAKLSVLVWLKLLVAFSHAALQLALLILWSRDDSIRKTVSTVPACALAFVVAISIIPLSVYEHFRALGPSFVIEVFLLLSLLFDTARSRTIWLLGESTPVAAVFSCTVALKAVMFILESTEKRRLLLPAYRQSSREAASGTVSRAFLAWLYPLLWLGYKRSLGVPDLVTLDKGLSSETLYSRFQEAWDAAPNKQAGGALLNTWFVVLRRPLLAPAFPRLCLTALTFAQPFLITAAINLALMPRGQPYDNHGYGLIAAFIFVYFGLAFATVKYEYRAYRAAVISRGSLVPCLFEKTLRLHIADADSKAALTLFSTDMETITRGVAQMHEIWASLLEVALALWLLERQLGVSTVIPICVVIATMIFGGVVAAPTGKQQAAWIQASQKRVSETSYLISNMKWVRFSGLTSFAFNQIQELRTQELRVSERYRTLLTWVMLSSSVVPQLVPLLTYVTYANLARQHNDTLGLAKAFTSFSLFVLLVKPLGLIVVAMPAFASAAASIARVQAYLNRPEKSEHVGKPHCNDHPPSRGTDEKGPGHENSSVPALSEKTEDHLARSSAIISASGQLKWPDAEKPVLALHEVEIPYGSLTVLLGPIACGKSTMLQLFLGEMTEFEGNLKVHTESIAYCAQQPFIPSRTCREVIVGNLPYNELWYSEVVKACALQVDFDHWAERDATLVSSAAASLSGGQKQRLALARAVYSKKELVLLDDSFNGLDDVTADRVFNSLLGPAGLLRNSGTTIVLASSSIHRAVQADHVILLSHQGSVLDKGSFPELQSRSKDLASLDLRKIDDKNAPIGETGGKTDSKSPGDVDAKVAAALLQSNEEEIKLNRPTAEASVYQYYLESAGRNNLVVFAACLVGIAFFDTFPSVWLKWWAESNVGKPNGDLAKWLGGYGGLTAGGIVAAVFGSRQLFIKIISKSGFVLHDRLAQAVFRANTSFFFTVDRGITVNRFSQDLQLIDMQLPVVTLGTAIGLVYAIGQTVVMAVASKYIIIAVVVLVILFYFIQSFYLRTSRQVRFLDIELKAPLYSQLIETGDGLASIRAFGYENKAREEHRKILEDSQRGVYTLYCLQRWLILTVDLVIAILAVILAAITTSLRDQDGAGNIGLSLVNLIGLAASIRTVLVTWVTMEIAIGAVARIRSFVKNLKAETDNPDLVEPPESWPNRGDMELKNVSASYSASSKPLNDITLSIRHGEKIAICGRTGSGKSSLLLAFASMLDLDQGSIVIDGLDTAKLTHESVRSRLVAVPQQAVILHGTVRQNLDPHGRHDDEEITAALQRCVLQEDVVKLGGLDASITEVSFSHGQRQLFSICRAMLRKSKIVLMDEPNSSLDSKSTQVIDDVIASWDDATLIIALHKMESIFQYDRVAFMDQGRLVALDSPHNLLSAEGNHISSLLDSTV